jgi:hypothetical protein
MYGTRGTRWLDKKCSQDQPVRYALMRLKPPSAT